MAGATAIKVPLIEPRLNDMKPSGPVRIGGVPSGTIMKSDVFERAKEVAKTNYNLGVIRQYMITARKAAKQAASLPGSVVPNATNTPNPLPGVNGAIIPPPQPPEPRWGSVPGTKGGDIIEIRPRRS